MPRAKVKDLPRLVLYCLPGVRRKLERLAEDDRRSLSNTVCVLIEDAYERSYGDEDGAAKNTEGS